MRRNERTRQLCQRLNKALQSRRLVDAAAIYQLLEKEDPTEPRWPHRHGDLLRRLDKADDALKPYERAVALYAGQGFIARATAMAKMILAIDPGRTDVLAHVNPEEARRLHRKTRDTIVTADDTDEQARVSKRKRITEDALELEVDETAATDEVRFRDPEAGKPTVEIDVSELELVGRPTPPPVTDTLAPEPEDKHPSAEELAQLPSTPLFAEVPQEAFAQLVKESVLVDLEDGGTLIQSGTTADALFVIVEGSLEVRDPRGATLVLGEGEVAGVSCLLADVTYRDSAIARGRIRALRISKLLLDRLVARYPAVGDVLFEVLGRRVISGFVRSDEMFLAFDESKRVDVARMFEVRRAPEGTILLEAGKRSDGLYIPLLGELVAKDASGRSVGTPKLGRPLGQRSLLTRGPTALTIEALSEVLLLRMPADRFHDFAAAYPAIVAHLEQLAKRASEPEISLYPPPPGATTEP